MPSHASLHEAGAPQTQIPVVAAEVRELDKRVRLNTVSHCQESMGYLFIQ